MADSNSNYNMAESSLGMGSFQNGTVLSSKIGGIKNIGHVSVLSGYSGAQSSAKNGKQIVVDDFTS